MKSIVALLWTSVACAVMAAGLGAQEVIPISFGEIVPVADLHQQILQVSGSCNTCAPKLSFQACCDSAKPCPTAACAPCAKGCGNTIVNVACPGGCQVKATPTCSAPACAAPACAPKVVLGTPCPCDAPKHVSTPCCVTKPAPCTTCTAKPVHQPVLRHAAPCNTCSAPVAAPKTCDAGCPKAAAPCSTCNSCGDAACKQPSHHHQRSYPLLDGIKKIFTRNQHAPVCGSGCATPAVASCSTCAQGAPIQAVPAPAVAPMPTQPVQPMPRAVYQQDNLPVSTLPASSVPALPTSFAPAPAPVPAALAPYSPGVPFSTAYPPAESGNPNRDAK